MTSRLFVIEICCFLVAFGMAQHHVSFSLSRSFRNFSRGRRKRLADKFGDLAWNKPFSAAEEEPPAAHEEEEPPPLPSSSGAYASWTQCDTTHYCVRFEDFDSTLDDCEGNDNNCPGDSKCLIPCTSEPYMCYDPTKNLGERCYDYACDSEIMACPNGEECVKAVSDECEPKVCKNTTMSDDRKACISNSTCDEDTDCTEGYSCVTWSGNCGLQ
mmetsp:Transcript_5139/g.5742  ORF Transcript_5139/g.5742 Transcript_5139/m.5742 type:complete len:214 (+) Transcript_5139:3-644(+)